MVVRVIGGPLQEYFRLFANIDPTLSLLLSKRLKRSNYAMLIEVCSSSRGNIPV